MLNRLITLCLVAVTLVACARDNFSGEEVAIQPITISGSNITSARLRCGPTTSNGNHHQTACSIHAEQADGSVVPADRIVGVTATWSPATSSSANVIGIQCSVSLDLLSQSCETTTTDTVPPTLTFNLEISDGSNTRIENFNAGLHNYKRPFDVSDDGFISAIDLLHIVNWLNGPMVYPTTSGAPYMDVTGDGIIDAADAYALQDCLNDPICSP